MLYSTWAPRCMAVAPHALAAQAAVAILREGGNAIEAMLAAASTIAVVYPHMNGIGGDGFWLVAHPDEAPVAIDASGPAAQGASIALYAEQGLDAIPTRGGLAAITVAGTVGGWEEAAKIAQRWGGRLSLQRLLSDAIFYAEHGVAVTHSQVERTRGKLAELETQPGFAAQFLGGGRVPAIGERLVQPAMAATLRALASDGLDAFYRGAIAASIAQDLAAAGSPLTLEDLRGYRATTSAPLHVRLRCGDVYNTPPPTQGVLSLAILALLERLEIERFSPESAAYVHRIVEATKQAFLMRNRYLADPRCMTIDPQAMLDDAFLAPYLASIRTDAALPWGEPARTADTIWMGAIDSEGRAVSFIQSLYHEFGSGIVLPQTGIVWQDRGCSFSLDPTHVNALAPGKKPFHTLNPAFARLRDGRAMVYGTMGGDGQPQTQAAFFTRYVAFGQSVQAAISAPRWILGRTWGEYTQTLKLESRFSHHVFDELRALGHDAELLEAFSESAGHAGAIVRHPSGMLEGGSDPRSDGAVAGI